MSNSLILMLLQQTACSLALLMTAGAVFTPRPGRMAGASVLGGLTATAAMPPCAWWLRPAALAAILALMPCAVWPGAGRRLQGRIRGLLLALTLLLGGWMRQLQGLGVPAAALLPAGCLSLPLVGRLWPQGDAPRCVTLDLTLMGRRLRTTGLVDTGNLLRDAVTGLPVVVISRAAAKRCIALPPPGEVLPGMRLMPVQTACGRATLLLLRPDSLAVLTSAGQYAAGALVGISPVSGGPDALVPPTLLTPLSIQGGADHDHDLPAGIHCPRTAERAGCAAEPGRTVLHRRARSAARAPERRGGAQPGSAAASGRGGACNAHRAQPAPGGVHRPAV